MSENADTQSAGTAGEPDAPTEVDAAPAADPAIPGPQPTQETEPPAGPAGDAPASEPSTGTTETETPVAAASAPAGEPREAPAAQAIPAPAPAGDTDRAPRRRRVGGGRIASVGAVVLAAAVAGGGTGAVVAAGIGSDGGTTVVRETVTAPDSGKAVPTSSMGATVGDVYRAASPSVVQIEVTMQAAETPFGGESGTQRALGSGFVYDGSNHVVTNQHVVDSATSVRVTTRDGKTYDARVVGTDPSTDLAVVEVDAPAGTLKPLELGDSDSLEVGDQVVAIGSPFGLQTTLTSGVVSALDREITAPDGFTISHAIQTDAAINHGNSGGPLLNMNSEVVGVNAQMESDSGGNDGVGFAIPANTVKSVASSILEHGRVEHAYLGVTLATIPPEAAARLDQPAGAAIAEVKSGTPAAEAGLRGATGTELVNGQELPTGGDVVTAADGETISSSDDLQAAIEAKRPGDTIRLTVLNGGRTRTVTVTLGDRPA